MTSEAALPDASELSSVLASVLASMLSAVLASAEADDSAVAPESVVHAANVSSTAASMAISTGIGRERVRSVKRMNHPLFLNGVFLNDV
jgi:L-asparaginase II